MQSFPNKLINHFKHLSLSAAVSKHTSSLPGFATEAKTKGSASGAACWVSCYENKHLLKHSICIKML